MKKLVVLALLGAVITDNRLSAESIKEREKLVKEQPNKPLKVAQDATPSGQKKPIPAAAKAPKIANTSDTTPCDQIMASSTSAPIHVGQTFVPISAPQAFSITPNSLTQFGATPLAVSSLTTSAVPSYGTASAPVVLSQPVMATAPVIFNSFAPAARRGFGPSAIRQPAAVAAASGYSLAPAIQTIPYDTHSIHGADYTVYYRGVGSVVVNSPRLFPVADGQLMAPIYVPTPIAYPSYTGR